MSIKDIRCPEVVGELKRKQLPSGTSLDATERHKLKYIEEFSDMN